MMFGYENNLEEKTIDFFIEDVLPHLSLEQRDDVLNQFDEDDLIANIECNDKFKVITLNEYNELMQKEKSVVDLKVLDSYKFELETIFTTFTGLQVTIDRIKKVIDINLKKIEEYKDENYGD